MLYSDYNYSDPTKNHSSQQIIFGDFCPSHSKQIKSKMHWVHICRLQKIYLLAAQKKILSNETFPEYAKIQIQYFAGLKKSTLAWTAGIGRLLRFFDFLCALNVPCHTVRNEFAYSWLPNKPTITFILWKKKSLDLGRQI